MAANKEKLPSNEVPNDVLEQIARRAYELYVWRGREDGHDLDDWLQAEAEIMGEAAKAA
jgi:hypothetical protein